MKSIFFIPNYCRLWNYAVPITRAPNRECLQSSHTCLSNQCCFYDSFNGFFIQKCKLSFAFNLPNFNRLSRIRPVLFANQHMAFAFSSRWSDPLRPAYFRPKVIMTLVNRCWRVSSCDHYLTRIRHKLNSLRPSTFNIRHC